MVLRLHRTAGLLIALAAPSLGAEAEKPSAAQVEFFEKNVRPVLANRCWSCHGAGKIKAGLRLDSREAVLKGGDSGPAVVPGNPDASPLVVAVHYVETPQMPPKGKLSDAEIASLSSWVKDGAYWPETVAKATLLPATRAREVTAEDRAFWSFQPVGNPEPPDVNDTSWPRTAIDRFVLAGLEEKGLHPVAPADKRTLIRRAAFDLTGLPPTPGEVEAFVGDPSPEAFARVVDRLLASPHYGERWGRHWLDVARYAEDQAHTFQPRLYPYGYRYRDWVAKALNDDMPYDRFIVEQVAGDLLTEPGREVRLAALGFFALGPVYYGNAKTDELDDRIDTLCRGFLGLTVACARCHDHKFDPVPTRDYYSLGGIIASTEYKEYPNAPADVVAAYDKAQEAIRAKTAEVAKLLQDESTRLPEVLAGETSRYMLAAWTLINERKTHPERTVAELARREKLHDFALGRWVTYLFSKSGGPQRAALATWRKLIESQDRATDLSTNDAARLETARVAGAFQDHVRSVLSRRDANKTTGSNPSAVPLSNEDQNLLNDLTAANGVFTVPKRQVEPLLSASAKQRLKGLRGELDGLKKKAPPLYPLTHSLTEAATIANLRVHLRGNPETLGEEAPRKFLAVLSAPDARPFTQGSGRLELARAIASADNPLTARVMVNRVWEHHFGRGLVGTPSNFGKMGERPTHPQLLDYLAHRFVALGWSLKALHREIMLSATYQLGSDFDSTNHEADPGNTRLWRMSRRRLEVEAWRDAMLAVAGNLDPAIGGPSFDLASPANSRRTFYAKISRHNLDGLLRLFDFPDPNLTCDKRTVTTVPLQQLFVLNSEFIERQAKLLAARLTAVPGEPDANRIRRAFRLLYGRPATDAEVTLGAAFVGANADGAGGGSLSRWEQYAQVLLGSNEFSFLD